MNIRGVVVCLAIIIGFAPEAEAGSSLRIEVREPKRARLVSADVWIRTTAGKLLKKVYASGGRAQVGGLPSTTVVLEFRSRRGGLYAKTRVKAQPNRVTRVAVKLGPAPKPTKLVAKSTRPKTARANIKPKRTAPRKVAVARHKTRRTNVVTNDRRAVASVAGTPRTKRTVKRATEKNKSPSPKTTVVSPQVKDWGRGKRRVCRGDVFGKRGRRISGRVLIRRGSTVVGFSRVKAGYFSLYDLKAGTYRIEFTDSKGVQRAASSISIKTNKLPKVVLRAR